eukprot:2665953-Prymnesium_polylepis.1
METSAAGKSRKMTDEMDRQAPDSVQKEPVRGLGGAAKGPKGLGARIRIIITRYARTSLLFFFFFFQAFTV